MFTRFLYNLLWLTFFVIGCIYSNKYGLNHISILCWMFTVSAIMFRACLNKLNVVLAAIANMQRNLEQSIIDVNRSCNDLDIKIEEVNHTVNNVFLACKKPIDEDIERPTKYV